MSWAVDRARELLAQAKEKVSAGRGEVAAATLVRAFDVLETAKGVDAATTSLKAEIVRALHAALPAKAPAGPLLFRAASVLSVLAPERALLRGLVDRALGMPAPTVSDHDADEDTGYDGDRPRTTKKSRLNDEPGAVADTEAVERPALLPPDLPLAPEHEAALEIFLAAAEQSLPLPATAQREIDRRLIQTLRIPGERPDRLDQLRIRRLQRLVAARPRLDFAKLYLGRARYYERRYQEAWGLLAGISGPIAATTRVLNLRARCAEKLHLLDEADALYGMSLAKKETQPGVHLRLGRLLLSRVLDAAAT